MANETTWRALKHQDWPVKWYLSREKAPTPDGTVMMSQDAAAAYLNALEAKLKAVQDDFNLVMQGLAAPFGECFTLPDGNCIGRGCMHDRDADKLKAAEDALRANCLGCKNNWRMIGESNDHEGRNKDGTWFFHRCTNGSKLRAALNAVTRQPLNGGGEQ